MMESEFDPHVYRIVLTDFKERMQKTVIVVGCSRKCAEIDALDMHADGKFYNVKSIEQLPCIAKHLVAFPKLVNVLFKVNKG